MSHNISSQIRRANVLAGQVVDFREWTFNMARVRCRRYRLLPMVDLLVICRSNAKI